MTGHPSLLLERQEGWATSDLAGIWLIWEAPQLAEYSYHLCQQGTVLVRQIPAAKMVNDSLSVYSQESGQDTAVSHASLNTF